MQIKYHREFAKNYKKRIAQNLKLVNQFQKQLEKFIQDPNNPILKDHKLIGKKSEFRAFSITGDIRVVYKIVDEEIWLYDIGSHNQVY
ncbi:MAG: type II toxin-antitoxin system mRNA interferase toxin, RelE/StbE family [Candidatus Daviesbacteria bacterium]|nr:type II toxin-antitoxin system mRNA interferase toxin, RelE/StbE family [Candidatus Daviesbacteria bacterium]